MIIELLVAQLLAKSSLSPAKIQANFNTQRAGFEICLVQPNCKLSNYSGINSPALIHSNRNTHLIPPVKIDISIN